MKRIYKLKGVVQHYSWGGKRFIPQLLQVDNAEAKPYAEYWLGAHPSAPSALVSEEENLATIIQQHPQEILGEKVAKQFGGLPYLFKVLDVAQMLSIQVHPSIESAIEGFEDEEKRGISIKAPNRNYKDKNHKPEAMVALSGFWLLHGFKPADALRQTLQTTTEISFLLPVFEAGGYEGLYAEVMNLPQAEVNRMLERLVERVVPPYQAGTLQKSSEDFWAARAALHFCKDGQYDRGIFSIYLFNLLHLHPNEAIYQPAGLPHAYLEGQNVELMANSDNVLRAGLTDKHIDVPELMKHVKFEPTIPKILQAEDAIIQTYQTPAEEFLLTRYALNGEINDHTDSPAILIVTEGSVIIKSADEQLDLTRGEVAFLIANTNFHLMPANGTATIFSASVPG